MRQPHATPTAPRTPKLRPARCLSPPWTLSRTLAWLYYMLLTLSADCYCITVTCPCMHPFSQPGRPHRTKSLKIQPDDRASLNHHTPPALLSPCLSSNCATLEGGSCLPLAPIGRFRARRRCCRARVRSVGTFHARRPLVAAGARHASERRELTLGARRGAHPVEEVSLAERL